MMYVLSSPIVPPGFSGVVEIRPQTPEQVRAAVNRAFAANLLGVTSFVGHPATAEYLGVPMNRGELHEAEMVPGTIFVGIRPLKRPTPGQELPVTPGNFEGFFGVVVSR